jgi:hypothetical protein
LAALYLEISLFWGLEFVLTCYFLWGCQLGLLNSRFRFAAGGTDDIMTKQGQREITGGAPRAWLVIGRFGLGPPARASCAALVTGRLNPDAWGKFYRTPRHSSSVSANRSQPTLEIIVPMMALVRN